jgi:hypothetical protein
LKGSDKGSFVTRGKLTVATYGIDKELLMTLCAKHMIDNLRRISLAVVNADLMQLIAITFAIVPRAGNMPSASMI